MVRHRRPPPTGAFWFAVLAFALMSLLALGYFARLGWRGIPWGPFLLLALSHFGSWALLLGLILAGAARLVRSQAWFAALASGLLTLLLLLLALDAALYALFREHANGLVLNVILGGAVAEDAHLGWQTVVSAAALTALLAGVQAWFWTRLEPRLARVPARGAKRAAVALVLAATAADKGVYAWSDLANRPRYLAAARAFPLYVPATMKRFAERHHLAVAPGGDVPALQPGGRGSLLAYPPVVPASCGPSLDPPNFLVIVIDSVRADLLDDRHMPRVAALARRWWRFDDHLSGGNATRYGLFSILYGLDAGYWDAFLAERRGPALLDALKARGYDFKVVSSTSLAWPELRRTGFAAIPGAVEDELGGARPADRDRRHPERVRAFLDRGRRPGHPFFIFCFLDGPHAPYDYPDAYARFQPAASHINYLVATWQGMGEAHVNRYRNAVLFDDALAGEMVDDLAARGLLDRTVVAVTSDHGEEFMEAGHWGHTSAFTLQQCRVPLVLHVPGRNARRVGAPTSHLDLAPAFLELAGCPALAASHTQGHSLLRPGPRGHRVVEGWHACGVWLDGRVVTFNTDFKRAPALEVRDASYAPLAGAARAAALAAARPELLKVLEEQRRFLK